MYLAKYAQNIFGENYKTALRNIKYHLHRVKIYYFYFMEDSI